MKIEPQDTVYYIRNNLIYKGTVVADLGLDDDGLFQYFRVQSHDGLLVLGDYEIYDTVEKLAESIMHESCWS